MTHPQVVRCIDGTDIPMTPPQVVRCIDGTHIPLTQTQVVDVLMEPINL